MSFLSRLKTDPYWISMIPQALFALILLGSFYWGEWFLCTALGLLLYGLFFGLNKRVDSLYDQAKEKDPKGQFKVENFKIIFKGSPWLPERFTLEQDAKRAKDSYFDFWVYAFLISHFILLFASMFIVQAHPSILTAVSLGILWFILSPIMEAISHEFIHRRSYFQQMFGGAVWASFFYGTFLPEHCMGHHVHVSTPEDASSAPKNMSIYQFLPRAMLLNPINGFKLEAKRLRDRNLSLYGRHNRLIWLTLISFALLGLSYLVAGGVGILFYLAYTLICILTIEVANYGMHYGLERKKQDNGRYERVSPLHSWNRESPGHIFSANLTRHSDHHAFPRRPYQILRNFPDAPQLPIPYFAVLTLPFFTDRWFRLMNPFVDAHMQKLERWRAEGIDDYQMIMGMDGSKIASE